MVTTHISCKCRLRPQQHLPNHVDKSSRPIYRPHNVQKSFDFAAIGRRSLGVGIGGALNPVQLRHVIFQPSGNNRLLVATPRQPQPRTVLTLAIEAIGSERSGPAYRRLYWRFLICPREYRNLWFANAVSESPDRGRVTRQGSVNSGHCRRSKRKNTYSNENDKNILKNFTALYIKLQSIVGICPE